jgi:hypothetical protein
LEQQKQISESVLKREARIAAHALFVDSITRDGNAEPGIDTGKLWDVMPSAARNEYERHGMAIAKAILDDIRTSREGKAS